MKPFSLKKLTNNQLQYGFLAAMLVVLMFSFVDALARPLLLGVVIIAPIAIGFAGAIVFHHMDQVVQYATHFNGYAHARLAIVLSILIGAVVKHLGTQLVLLPNNAFTTQLLLFLAPKALFFIGGVILTAVGYYLGWLETSDER